MNYDKNSFLAGLSVGRTLKGWAGGDIGASGELSEIVVRSGVADFVEVPAEGYYGIGKVTVRGDANLIPSNIKNGVSILGVEGTYTPTELALYVGTTTITTNGTHTIYPLSGYDGFTRVRVVVDVDTTPVVVDATLQSKSVTPGYSSVTVTPDSGYDGLSSVYVSGDSDLVSSNIKEGVTIFGVTGTFSKNITLQSKSVSPGSSSKTVKPDTGYDGLSQVTVDAVTMQSRSVNPGRNAFTIYPESGYTGISSVYVAGDSDLISSNIREGVTIFGVAGSYSNNTVYQNKAVTPTRSGFIVTADAGYNALAQVTVAGDSNLVESKIAKGVTIFGVTGTYVSPMKPLTVVPSVDEQYIVPGEGFFGFSSVTVAPGEASGEYSEGFADGVASRDDEVAALQEQVATLTTERDEAYQNGYDAGYEQGAADIAASYTDLDEEEF